MHTELYGCNNYITNQISKGNDLCRHNVSVCVKSAFGPAVRESTNKKRGHWIESFQIHFVLSLGFNNFNWHGTPMMGEPAGSSSAAGDAAGETWVRFPCLL